MSELYFIGSRNKEIKASASEAILAGICPDGGLYLPESFPRPDKSLGQLYKLSYQELAYEILKLYLTDFTEEELRGCINGAYDGKFDTETIAPLVKQGDTLFLELFHGKTLAFKDMALSILPYFMKVAAKKQGIDKEIVILTATSGDTGKAALEGFSNVEGTRIFVFFPESGVSTVQKLQMVTQEGENTCVVGIEGNFDDAQSAVKDIFTDKALAQELSEKGYLFSSANSINIGRLLPQVVYYYSAYLQAVRMGEIALGEPINVTVPTGNFGNLLAGYYAKAMGLPIKNFICASNENKVLYDFFTTGEYNKNRMFVLTTSPSMDILISSNLERLLCHMAGQEKTAQWMEGLATEGRYQFDVAQKEIFGGFATEGETTEAIRSLFEKSGYVMDTHTAVAYSAYQKYKKETGDQSSMIIVSTASPYKFTKDVMIALDKATVKDDDFVLMEKLAEVSGVSIPEPIQGLNTKEIRHSQVCSRDGIKAFVKKALLGE